MGGTRTTQRESHHGRVRARPRGRRRLRDRDRRAGQGGRALRYRGVDIEDLVGRVSFGKVWGLLVDNEFEPGLPAGRAVPAPDPLRRRPRRRPVRRSRCSPRCGAAARCSTSPTTTARENLAPSPSWRCRSSRSPPAASASRWCRRREIDQATTIAERFLIRWRGEPDPRHVQAVDAYSCSAAEHGMNASTFTARVIASTGADVAAAFSGAIGAMSGPLHGGAPSRVLGMIEDVEQRGDARRYVKELLDHGERLMGFGHRVYRAEDPRARVLRRTARELGAPRYEVAEALEKAALGRAARAPPGPGARDQRRVLGRDRARLRRGPRARCSPRCSPARARPAGRRTSSSRSAPAA